MPRLTFVSPDGARCELEAEAGVSIMRVALVNGVDEIVAECGGSLACGTCHVYVEPTQLHLLPPVGASEDEMLGFVAAERRAESRLSCQIVMSEALDGLVVHLPSRQE
jgi:2Fe-2S ferredoxin